MKRIEANDPAAINHMGEKCYNEGDLNSAVEYFTKAAELGDSEAHYRLSLMYHDGIGVERDEEKEIYHLEKAAAGGHPEARHNLACEEGTNGNIDRAVKHFVIAANQGWEKSMKALWMHYSDGDITKNDLDATIRRHHAALDATKSPQREAGEKAVLVHRGMR